MNYEKLTVERFATRLKEGAYKGLTGARRAIGKVGDWTKNDKVEAHRLADKHFAAGGKSSTAAPKAAAKRAPKVAAKKRAAKAAPKKAATAKKAAAAKPAAPPPAPKAAAAPKAQAAPKRSPTVSVAPGAVVPPGPPILEEVTRQNSASAVIAAYRNSGSLNPLEQRAYDVATAEYAENASKAAKRIVATAARGIPTPSPLTKADEDDAPRAVVTAPAGAPPRIPVPNGAEPELTPEEQAQYDRLERGAAAVPAIIGQG